MWVSKFRIRDVKAFQDTGDIELSKGINLLLAPNNAGKTTVLRCLYALQESENEGPNYPRLNSRLGGEPIVEIELSELNNALKGYVANRQTNSAGQPAEPPLESNAAVQFARSRTIIRNSNGNEKSFVQFKAEEGRGADFPAWIYPFMANRKKAIYEPAISAASCRRVNEVPNQLYSKLDALAGSGNSEFATACREILGMKIASIQVDSGKKAGLMVDDSVIPISEMGEGIRNLLQIIRDLIVAKGHLFLIEEPENDIHPRALKSLLRLILEKAETNQFIISTHSNIVAKYLGGQADTRIFTIAQNYEENGVPTSIITKLEDSDDARRRALEDLGYDLFDYNLWSAYLILEESSAERIINDLLIPAFAPSLRGKLRTIACGGVSDVEPRFEDFLRLFVFIHKETVYFQKAWVVVDGGAGNEVVGKLRGKFKSWDSSHFRALSKPDFELYYPERFQNRAEEVLSKDKQTKRKAKLDLLQEVLAWIGDDPETAKKEFETSAGEIIKVLREIESVLEPKAPKHVELS